MTANSRKPASLLLRVAKGALVPANAFSAAQLRARGYRIGDELSAVLKKGRNPKFHRLVHQFAALLADNLDEFTGWDAHKLIKRLQLESGVCCDEMQLRGEFGVYIHRVPQSLSFENMDEGEFHEFYRDLCRHVAGKYWPTLTPEKIEQMAGLMAEVA